MAHKGSKLESLVMSAAAVLESHGALRLHRWPVPMRVEPRPRQCQCGQWTTQDTVLWTGHTGSDFFGLTGSGRAVLIEAKMTSRPRLPLGSSSGMTKQQVLEQLDWHRAGALALLVWAYGDEVAVIDPDVWCPGEIPKGISWKEIPFGIKKPLDCQLEDLLEPYVSIRELSRAASRES